MFIIFIFYFLVTVAIQLLAISMTLCREAEKRKLKERIPILKSDIDYQDDRAGYVPVPEKRQLRPCIEIFSAEKQSIVHS